VDVYIDSFPVANHVFTLDALYAGVPVISYKGIRRIEINDFVPEEFPKWRNYEEYLSILCSVNNDELKALSLRGKEHFNTTSSREVLYSCIIENRSFAEPDYISFADDQIHDVLENTRVFNSPDKMTKLPKADGQDEANKDSNLSCVKSIREMLKKVVYCLTQRKAMIATLFLTDILLFTITLIGITDIEGKFKVFLLLAFAVVGLIGLGQVFMAVVLKIHHRRWGKTG